MVDSDNSFFNDDYTEENDEFEKLDKIMDILHRALKETEMLEAIDSKMTIAIGTLINNMSKEDQKDYSKIILYAAVVWLISSSLNLSLEGFTKMDKLKVLTMIKYNLSVLERHIENSEDTQIDKKKVN